MIAQCCAYLMGILILMNILTLLSCCQLGNNKENHEEILKIKCTKSGVCKQIYIFQCTVIH